VYVQRLRGGDAADLAGIGAPWYTDREKAARRLIAEFGTHADKPVEAVVTDPVAPSLTTVNLGAARRSSLPMLSSGRAPAN
jgi:hypothetical protein